MCRLLEVSTSGYYAWRTRPESRRMRENRCLLVKIKAIFSESDETYGSPRVYRDLRALGQSCSENRVARIMRVHGLRAKQARRFRVTTDSEHEYPLAENLLERQFEVTVPNARWAADITYVWTREGWLYLAMVMDLFSRRIVGWSMQASLARQLVIDAMQMALGQRRPPGGLLHHSDRGCQYASGEYRQLLTNAGCMCSMSRRGNCWDNAPVESFFSTLKRERVHHRQYRTREEARQDLFHYIECWYNRKRRHSSLGYLSPAAYEEAMAAQTVLLAA